MFKTLYQELKRLKIPNYGFADLHQEAEFQEYHAHKFVNSTRAATLVSIFLISIFGILDLFMLPDSYLYAWSVRFLFIDPFLVFLFFFTYTKVYFRFAQLYLCIAVFLVGFSISVIIYFSYPHEPGFHYYYTGILLVIMFVFTQLRIQLKYALISTLTMILSYLLVATLKQKIHVHYPSLLGSHLSFMMGMELLSFVAGFTIEYYQRKDFVQRKIIEDRQEALEHEIRTASRIQQSILPGEDIYEDRNVQIGARYMPMVNIGGDFYDFKKIRSRQIGLIVADVSGHGVPAALVASMVKVSFHSAKAPWERPDLVLKKINDDLYAKIGLSFITALYLCFNLKEKKCAVSQAGHPPLLVHNRKSGYVRKYKPRGFPLGVFKENELTREVFDFDCNDRFLLCTDGLYEAIEQAYPGQEVQVSDILKEVKELKSPDEALQEINVMLGLSFRESRDDITMVIADIPRAG